jgi:hypothetical protein
MTMDDYGWLWIVMDGHGWSWMVMDNYLWLWMTMDDHRWLWLVMDSHGRPWTTICDHVPLLRILNTRTTHVVLHEVAAERKTTSSYSDPSFSS